MVHLSRVIRDANKVKVESASYQILRMFERNKKQVRKYRQTVVGSILSTRVLVRTGSTVAVGSRKNNTPYVCKLLGNLCKFNQGFNMDTH